MAERADENIPAAPARKSAATCTATTESYGVWRSVKLFVTRQFVLILRSPRTRCAFPAFG
jgi:hypothetical protein